MATADTIIQEFIVIMRPYNLDFSEFVGSRAMLEAEGIMPEATMWPEGYNVLRWQDGTFDYRLCRQRPEGAKGPRKQFIDCDWWCLRWKLSNQPSHAERAIAHQSKALKDEIYRHSAKGQAEWDKQLSCYLEAAMDKKFQAFKALIPSIIRPKRGRKPKEAEASKASNN